MRNLRIGVMLVVGLLWAGGVWAAQADKAPKVKVPATGQVLCYDTDGNIINCSSIDWPGQDGALQSGFPLPTPRFADNNNGTITDKLTGLIWLKNASCGGTKTWQAALQFAVGLKSGDCGLTDGTVAGQWRLPNIRELHSLVDFAFSNPAISNAAGTAGCYDTAGDCAFDNFQSSYYWSSTTYQFDSSSRGS